MDCEGSGRGDKLISFGLGGGFCDQRQQETFKSFLCVMGGIGICVLISCCLERLLNATVFVAKHILASEKFFVIGCFRVAII